MQSYACVLTTRALYSYQPNDSSSAACVRDTLKALAVDNDDERLTFSEQGQGQRPPRSLSSSPAQNQKAGIPMCTAKGGYV